MMDFLNEFLTPKRKLWIKAAGVRAAKTFAQGLVAGIGTSPMTMGEVKWGYVLSTAVVMAILSLATSVAGLPEVKMATEAKEEG